LGCGGDLAGSRGEGGSEIKPTEEATELIDDALLLLLDGLGDGFGDGLGDATGFANWGDTRRGMALGGGILVMRVATLAGFAATSTCTLSIGLGDGLGVTISSTLH
jgi:hypothetical protein